ncbi:beta-1,3-galactosyltransferase 2-like isoform 1-T3 [Anomaloglossus baeobatrachus]|uniref:beta-1,3-galactosyltransferase 2-like n=1 Tax=Anomaloglossus baeobatrachus TaxID=238106 RepID=UPI003F50408F
MNRRIGCLKFFTLLSPMLVFMSSFLFHYKSKTKISYNSIQDSVSNLTYPTFKHPLAPPYPFPYKFLINQPDKCKNRKPFLLIMVLVESQDVESRHTIRETWGNESIYNVEVVRVFLVGLPQIAPKQTQDLLEEESKIFEDIVQQDFMDTYYNLTLKTLMGMEWVTKFCPSARYAMKIDTDMFLNVDYLIHNVLYPDVPVRTNYFTGNIYLNARPYRNKASKWYVPKEIYPNNTFPPYCAGPGYVFSADMATKIYDVAQGIKANPMEDVFMGMCLHKLHIPPTVPPRGAFIMYKMSYHHCKFRKVVAVHEYGRKELRKIWADFWTKRSQKC